MERGAGAPRGKLPNAQTEGPRHFCRMTARRRGRGRGESTGPTVLAGVVAGFGAGEGSGMCGLSVVDSRAARVRRFTLELGFALFSSSQADFLASASDEARATSASSSSSDLAFE